MTGRNVFQRKSLISGIRNSLLTQTRTWRRKSLAVSAILPTHLTLNLFQRLRCQSSVPTSPRVCIVGSGPAGFYTAQQLLKSNDAIHVDIFEKLPVPYGLVRFGVAPDHPEVKNATNTFEQVAMDERCRFFGNVNIGSDITTKELRDMYDAVVLAYGADEDRSLGVPGEDLEGVHSARTFVGWYNGLPAHCNLAPDLSCDTAVVVGQGNVALDVARILLAPVELLQHTDICDHSLEAFKNSKIKKVYVIGRRGPLEVSFTIKELREMIRLPGCRPIFRPEDFESIKGKLKGCFYFHHQLSDVQQAQEIEYKKDLHCPFRHCFCDCLSIDKELPRPKKRLIELMCQTALDVPDEEEALRRKEAEREWQPLFLRSPVEINSVGDGKKVKSIKLEINELVKIFRSIGYKSIQVDEGIPFDRKMGIIPNIDGRAIESAENKQIVKGLYCSGWVKHGPVGVILTTMTEAKGTALTILEDIKQGAVQLKSPEFRNGIMPLLESRGVKPISFSDWEKIDEEETRRGQKSQKPREKIISKDEMLKIALESRDE